MSSAPPVPLAAGAPAVRSPWGYWLKLGLVAATVWWLAAGSGWRPIAAALTHVRPAHLAAAVLLYLVGQTLCAWKWSLLGASLGFRQPFRFYWVHYLGAMFPGLFLPTVAGGDFCRIVALGRDGDRVNATVSVLADRGTGVLALVWIAAVLSLADPVFHRFADLNEAIYLLCGGLSAAFLAPFLLRRWLHPKGLPARALACWDDPRRLFSSLALAFVFQLLLCVLHWFIGQAMGLPVPPTFYFVLCPVVSVAAMSPMTLNGLGERFAALVILFSLAHIGRSEAIAFGAAWAAMVTVSALIGGLVLLTASRFTGWDRRRGEPGVQGELRGGN